MLLVGVFYAAYRGILCCFRGIELANSDILHLLCSSPEPGTSQRLTGL